MATSQEYAEYVCDQLSYNGAVTCRKMFGEYAIYYQGKVLGLICDNQVFIKPTAAGFKMLPDVELAPPYKGAKPYIMLEDIDDREFLGSFVSATSQELPLPKPRRKK